ncbi:MAG TPA: diguanylate cyclase [Firmicutes bacterium]|nr:diguanylate cyclase [Bacillota bacterium]
MKSINGRYEIIKEIGTGEYGIIYQVRDLYDKAAPIKALKLFDSDKHGKNKDSFFQEFLYARSVTLTCTAKYYDFSRVFLLDDTPFNGDYFYYTMEFVDGLTLNNYLFTDKNEKKNILEQITIAVQWLHYNGFWHGDLSPGNIIISFDKEIIFIDFFPHGHIEDEIREFKAMMQETFHFSVDDFRAHISKEEIGLTLLKSIRRLGFSPALIEPSLDNLYEHLRAFNKENFPFTLYNMVNFSEEYFPLAMQSVKPRLGINGLHVKEIFVNGDPHSFAREFYFALLHDPVLKTIFTADQNLQDSLKKITYDSFSNIHNKYARFIVERLLEGLNASGKTAVIIRNIRTADSFSKEVLSEILKNHAGKNLVFFINDNINREFYKESAGKNWIVIEDFTHPATPEFKEAYCSTLNRYLMSELTGLEFSHLCSIKQIDIIPAMRFLMYMDLSAPYEELIRLIATFDPEKNRSLFYDSLLSDPALKELLYQAVYLDNPMRISYFSELAGKKFQRLFQNLIIEGVFIPGAEKTVHLADQNLFTRIRNEIKKLSEGQQKHLAVKAAALYEKHETELSPQEKIALIINYGRSGDVEKAMNYLFRCFFVHKEASSALLKNNLSWYIKKLYSEIKKTSDTYPPRTAQIIHLAYISFADDLKEEIRLTNLKKMAKTTHLNPDIRMTLLHEVVENLLTLSRAGEMKPVIEEMKKLIPEVDFQFAIKAYLAEIQYFYSIQDIDTMIRLCRSLSQIIQKEQPDDPDNIGMKLITYYAFYYEHRGNLTAYKRIIEVYLHRTEQLDNPRFRYMAHSYYGYYYHLKGDSAQSRHSFQLALQEAETLQDFYYLMIAYNNLAVNEPDTQQRAVYYYQGLKFAEFTENTRNKILIILNLVNTVPPEEAYALYHKYEHFINQLNTEDAFVIQYRYSLYISLADSLLALKKMDDLKSLNTMIQKEKIEGFQASDATAMRQIFIKKSQLLLGDIHQGFLNDLPQILSTAGAASFTTIKDFLYGTAAWILPYSEIKSATRFFIEHQSKQGSIKTVSDLRVWHQLENNTLFHKRPDKIVRYIRFFYDNSSFPFINAAVRLHLAKALKSLGDSTYLCELSRIKETLKMIPPSFRENNPICQNIQKDFPEEYDRLFKNRNRPALHVKDFSLLIEDIKELSGKNLSQSDFFKSFLSLFARFFHFDRGLFVRNHFGQLKEESFFINRPGVFPPGVPSLYDKYISHLKDSSFIKTVKHPEIKNILMLPLINKKIWSRAKEKTKRAKKTDFNQMNYLEAFLYFDRSHDVNVKYNRDTLNTLLLFLNEYWQNRLSEDKYMRDPLTELYFKDVFLQKMKGLIFSEGERQPLPLSLLMIDIDNYKGINDTFGHQRGDAILREIAGLISKTIRSYDLAGRYGGDEFIVALPNTTLSNGRLIANRIREQVEHAQLMGLIRKITISIGLSHYPTDSRLIEELIQKADHCLLQAKEMGKNTIVTTHASLRS